jgi:hypothetical protein
LELGEEAKGIAISTALQAGSGEGTLADLIQLAEDVREIATKFADMAQSFKAATNQVKSSVASLEIFSGPSGKRGSMLEDVVSAAGSLANKVSLWVERVLILSDKMKNIEQTFNLSLGSLEEKPAAPERKTDVGLDQQDFPDGLLVEMHREESVFSEAGAPTAGLSGIIEKEQDAIFEGSAEPGDMFDELTGMEAAEAAPTAEERGVDFEKLPSGGVVQEIDEAPDVEDNSSDQMGFAHLPSDAAGGDVHSSKQSQDYGTVDLEETAAERIPRDAAQAPDAHPRVSPAAVKDEDAIDLYALGAVDYEENDTGRI